MALVGRARAHIDLGQPALAAADAQQVAPGYVKYATASDINSRRYNRVWQENSATSTLTSLGAPYINMTDPRVPLSFRGDSSVTKVPLYQQLKYPQSSSPIRLAARDEARLIIAEADLAAGDLVGADSIISNFRARGGQGVFTSTDPDTVKAALYDQRSREFFLEGQHLGDMIRFSVALNPPAGGRLPRRRDLRDAGVPAAPRRGEAKQPEFSVSWRRSELTARSGDGNRLSPCCTDSVSPRWRRTLSPESSPSPLP